MIRNDTIVAQITCPGKSAVGVLRISGAQSKTAAIVLLGQLPTARFATYSKFLDENSQVLDTGIALWFPAPHSFTGEDVLELQGHGSPLIIDLLMKRILSIKNIRIAKPGEFSERAFLNGKIDLVQAESIDDLINAETESSLRASLHSLQGNFSFVIQELINLVTKLRTNIEASIDFSEENVDINIADKVNVIFKKLDKKFLKIKEIVVEGNLLKEGKKIVIVGPPNAGKSSLLNVLSSSNRAIVTDVPGTTRDLLYEYININGVTCELIDTAGLRHTQNKVENIGIMRTWKTIKQSDHILFVIDKTIKLSEQKKICHEFISNLSHNSVPITVVLNKTDLITNQCSIKKIKGLSYVEVSAKTGEGINELRQHIIKIEKNRSIASIFLARRRHINQIDLAYNEFLLAKNQWKLFKNIECLADSLNVIQRFLGEITGRYTSSDLLDNIFSNFCIGK